MPITGPASYLTTIDEFLSHWEEVDTALGGGGGLILADGVDEAGLSGLRDQLETARDKVTDAALDRALAREQLNVKIMTLQARMVEFNGRIRADLPGSPYARVLPDAFAVTQGESIIRETLRTLSRLWAKVNAIAPAPAGLVLPLRLRGDHTLAMLDAEREALRTAYRALSDAELELKVAREQRNDLQEVIYTVLKNYRLKVPTAFAPGHALIDSLPRLTPESGRTPAPVAVTAVWDGAQEKAKITWDASTDAELKEYQVRGVPGDDYQADDEAVIATVPAGAAREFFTAFALDERGVTAGFKVYVILNSGHEAGSPPAYVTHPDA